MKRLQQTLDNSWEFAPDLQAPAVVDRAEFEPPESGWRPIVVPGYWQNQFEDLARATGSGWYRLSLELDASWLAHHALTLEFGAVGHWCQGWLNGVYVGEHEGGHLPFSWRIDHAAHVGTNALFVRVVSPSGDRSRFPDFPFEETLHGKQSWYGSSGGIWQAVSLEARSAHAISHLTIRPDAEASEVVVTARLASGAADASLRVEIVGPNDAMIAAADPVPPDSAETISLADHTVRRWSPDSPTLYRVRVTVTFEGGVVDVVERRFGFRTFTSDNGRFTLNGRPLFMRGVLDQDYHEAGVIGSRQSLIDRFGMVKAMGFNTLRCHVKVPDPLYLDAADEVGLLVWCELPTTSRLTHAAQERIGHTLVAMIERDQHHPSVVVWGIANEAWGYDLLGSQEHRSWLNELYHLAKTQAPDRLIVDNSPCAPNFHIETDIEDYHFYAVLPEMRQRWDDFIDDFANRADFTFSPHGDAQRTGVEPLVVSEFGAWGLPDLSELEDDEPWWFESGQEWAGGAAYVHGARQRFDLWHLDEVFASYADLCINTQRRQFDTLRYQIESMRARPEIAGYVLTELGDVHWEANGLLDMTGAPRSFAGELADVNRSPAVIARLDRPRIWSGDSVRVDVVAVNDDVDRQAVTVQCRTDEADDDEVSMSSAPAALRAHAHHRVDRFEVTASCRDLPRRATVHCDLRDGGELVATTQHPLLVVPRTGPHLDAGQVLVVSDDELAERLSTMGYTVRRRGEADDAAVRVMRHLDEDDHDFIERGGRGLLLAEDVDALGPGFGEFPPVSLRAWDDALFGGGEWVSAFTWLRHSDRFAGLPGHPILDASFEGLAPAVVITGIAPARFQYDVLAGVFVGWIHQVASIVARHHAGLGSILISTLKLTEHPADEDPLASWLLHQLITTAWEQQ